MIHASKPPPWPEGGPKIETFASGLIRKTQAYLVPTGEGQVIANEKFPIDSIIDEGQSLDDPFHVFPRPTIDPLNNGFERLNVTAYSRDPSVETIEVTYEEKDFDGFFEINIPLYPFKDRSGPGVVKVICPSFRVVKVFKFGESPLRPNVDQLFLDYPFYDLDGNIFDPGPFRVESGLYGDQPFGDPSISNIAYFIDFNPQVVRSSVSNYGQYSEHTFAVNVRWIYQRTLIPLQPI